MTASELRRWLKARGCSFEDGKKHTKVLLGTRVSYLPRRPGKEIRTGTLRTILKDLDLRM
jgi:predicted RNA binding protein YcfA (HicA-like mRNA interferase family)